MAEKSAVSHGGRPAATIDLRRWVMFATLALLAVLPILTAVFNGPFYLGLASRIMILAIAAVSLNLILGYGGMISFGHAAFIGIGAYSVGIAAYYGVYNAYIQWPVAIVASGLFALITGAICLRAKGIYFFMITLAFAQMIYFVFVSMDTYGGDDGLVLEQRSIFPGIGSLDKDIVLYYVAFGMLLLAIYIVHRIVNARFGMVIRGAKSNDERMQAIGYPTFRYQLVCYVIAGVMSGVAGVLLGNFSDFVNPDMMAWTRSGDLIFMVVLGGTGSLFGPVLGTIAFLTLEESLSSLPVIGVYWQIIFGPFLILAVLFARGGIDGFLGTIQAAIERRRARHD